MHDILVYFHNRESVLRIIDCATNTRSQKKVFPVNFSLKSELMRAILLAATWKSRDKLLKHFIHGNNKTNIFLVKQAMTSLNSIPIVFDSMRFNFLEGIIFCVL